MAKTVVSTEHRMVWIGVENNNNNNNSTNKKKKSKTKTTKKKNSASSKIDNYGSMGSSSNTPARYLDATDASRG